MSAADARLAMLAEMCACAHELGMAFAAEAKRVDDWSQKERFYRLFDRCFFAVRVSTVLEARLKAGSGWTPHRLVERNGALEPAETLEREEEPETETLERLDADRDREGERASLPILLKTLDGIVGEAEGLPGPQPAALPTLRELLAKLGAPPADRAPSAPSPLKARLAGSAAVAVATLDRPKAPLRSESLTIRRATGPPRR